jgi:hypothetical protein
VRILGWRLGRIAATSVGALAIWSPPTLAFVPLAALCGVLGGRLLTALLLARRTTPTENVHADLDRLRENPSEIVQRAASSLGFWSFVPAIALTFYGWGVLVSQVFNHPPHTLAGAFLVMSPFLLLYGWIFVVAYEAYALRSPSMTLTTGPSRQAAIGMGPPGLQRASGR